MDALWELAAGRRLKVVEDAAHAAGAQYKGMTIGSCGAGRSDAVAFSFYATKNVTTGEGGMVTCADDRLAARMRTLCLHGISADAWNRYSAEGKWRYDVVASGFKYNLSDIQAAIGLHQLRRLERHTHLRIAYANRYREALGQMAELEMPPDRSDSRHCWHLFSIRLNEEKLSINRAEFVRQLRARNIGASVHFIPIPLFSYFAAEAKLPQNHCPRALALYPRLLSLPLYPDLRDEELEYIIESVKEIARGASRVRLFAIGAGN
jgi:dTDP-4-amino-4,6-dideoxygalactose transaminase